ncbi:MAG: DUF4136 domain-containing protein [Bacteroidia bacterium]|nr:DUF4136 domain-containing protein [Bacteroidia bacterium]
MKNINLKPLQVFSIVTVAIGFTFIIGCNENYTVKSEKTKGVDFKKFSTYAWLPYADSVSVSIDHYQLMNSITSAIEAQLFKRKLKLDTINPHLLIRYSVMLNNSTTILNTPVYDYQPRVSYGMGYGWGYGGGGYGSIGVYNERVQVGTKVEQVPYRNGQLIIDFIDHSTNTVVWRGYAYGSNPIEQIQISPVQIRERVDKIINDIFWSCPIK